jgi:hypothetical protein
MRVLKMNNRKKYYESVATIIKVTYGVDFIASLQDRQDRIARFEDGRMVGGDKA